MPILHSLSRAHCGGNRLLGIYHDKLSQHWGWLDRAAGNCFAAFGIGAGWSATERRLLPRGVRETGLSMAARRGVHRFLNPSGYPLSGNLLRNKARFARHIALHQLPVAATFDPDAEELGGWLQARQAVIAKLGYSSKGRGVAAFRREGTQWRSPSGLVTNDELASHLHDYLARHGVVQELLSTHGQLKDISPGALPTLRVVTCRNEAGAPEGCCTVLRLGSGGDRPVDNFNAGGIAVRLDSTDRCIAAFRANSGAAESISVHPSSGAHIVGRDVPDLNEAIALGEQAHRTLPNGYTVVGWDIGLSDRGPMLVEGNWNPGTDIIQLVEGIGLDRTRLGKLYRFHLERVPDELWRASRAIEW